MASASIKRQRQRKRIDTDGDPEFQVAPMVDVLLVLMLFFMAITSTEVLKKNKNLTLADAEHGKQPDPTQSRNEILINVTWAGVNGAVFDMDGRAYHKAEAMQGDLASRFKQVANPAAAYVLIRADKNVEYSNVSDLMAVCSTVGIGTVTFAVITGGEKRKAPAASN